MDRLPAELFFQITSYLTVVEVVRCRQVSKAWQAACTSPAALAAKDHASAEAMVAITQGKPKALLSLPLIQGEPMLCGARLIIAGDKVRLIDLVWRTYKDYNTADHIILTDTALGMITGDILHIYSATYRSVQLPPLQHGQVWRGEGHNGTFVLEEHQRGPQYALSDRIIVIREDCKTYNVPCDLRRASKSIVLQEDTCYLIRAHETQMHITALNLETGEICTFQSTVLRVQPRLKTAYIGNDTWMIQGTALRLTPTHITYWPALRSRHTTFWQDNAFIRHNADNRSIVEVVASSHSNGCLVQPEGDGWGDAIINADFFVSWSNDDEVLVYTFNPDMVREEDEPILSKKVSDIDAKPCWIPASFHAIQANVRHTEAHFSNPESLTSQLGI